MTYKTLTNPTDAFVSVNFRGRVHELGPKESGEFDADVDDQSAQVSVTPIMPPSIYQ